jgi:hypothetical protein
MTETWLQDDERHPLIYNEFDLERARKAGTTYGERIERERIVMLISSRLAELRETSEPEPSEQERTLAWVVKLIRGTDD